MICKQYYITRGMSTRSLLFERALARQLAMPFIIQISVVYELSNSRKKPIQSDAFLPINLLEKGIKMREIRKDSILCIIISWQAQPRPIQQPAEAERSATHQLIVQIISRVVRCLELCENGRLHTQERTGTRNDSQETEACDLILEEMAARAQ